jgi:hypothetical protein
MNQRLKRNSKKNRMDQITVATGGWTARQSTQGKADEVNVEPVKKQENRGLAKASPAFKAIKPKKLPSVDDQKKSIAENTLEKKEDKTTK